MKTRIYILIIALFAIYFKTYGQGSWSQKNDFGGNFKISAIGFSIGNYGYLGLGYEITGLIKDFWQYDPSTDTWTQKSDFPGNARWNAVSFVIGNYGYVSTGFSNYTYYSDLWQYDPSSDTWTQKADLPGGSRWRGVGFSVGNKGYVGLGWNDNGLGGIFYNDLWEYDPASDTWVQMSNFPSTRFNSTTFNIGNKGYVLAGNSYSNGCLHQLWAFDPVSNQWTQKSPYPGNACICMVSFTIGNFAYAGTGQASKSGLGQEFYKYDPINDLWTPIDSFPGWARWMAVGFSVNNKGYVVTGDDGSVPLKDMWEYSPENLEINEINKELVISIFPNPATDKIEIETQDKAIIEILNIEGQIMKRQKTKENKTDIDISDFANGVYIIRAQTENGITTKKFVKE